MSFEIEHKCSINNKLMDVTISDIPKTISGFAKYV